MPNPPAFKEVWIAQRTDNPPAADGSPDNPYDGSTQAKFDTLMGLLAANTVIHLSPGKYTTLGYTTSPTPGVTRWSPRAGWRILGGGMGNTEIKILDDPTDPLRVHVEIIGGSVNNLTDFAEVSDLTANCNLAARSNASPYVSGAIHLVGDFCLISRVLAINWGTTSGPPLGSVEECFVLSTVSYFGPPSVSKIGGIVEGCIVTRPDPGVKHNDGVTAIFQSIGPTINPVQRHNFVYAIPIKPLSSSALGAPIYANPYSMPGCIGGLISENAVFDCQDHAIYADSSNVKHTLITANQFLRVWRGIRYRYYNTPPWEVSYLTVLNNFISLRDTALGVGIQLGIAGSFGGEEVIEPFVHGNMVSLYDGISAPGGLKGIDLYSAKKVSIADNLLALPPTASLITTDAGVTQAQYYNNRNSIGLPQPEMAKTREKRGPAHTEGRQGMLDLGFQDFTIHARV